MLRFIENSIVICIGFGILIFGFLPVISGATTTGLDAILNFQNSEYGESLIWLLVPATGLTMLAIIHGIGSTQPSNGVCCWCLAC